MARRDGVFKVGVRMHHGTAAQLVALLRLTGSTWRGGSVASNAAMQADVAGVQFPTVRARRATRMWAGSRGARPPRPPLRLLEILRAAGRWRGVPAWRQWHQSLDQRQCCHPNLE